MSIWVNIGSVAIGVVLIIFIIKQMVNKKITESQSILWIVIGLAAIIVGMFPSLINLIAEKLGIWYAPSIILLIIFVGLLFIVLKNTIVISVQSNQINELFMQVSLLNKENEELREFIEDHQVGGDND